VPDALNFIDGAEQRPADDLIEIHFLRMLAEHLDRPLWTDHPGEIHRALVARRLAEQAAAPLDARVLYWLEPLMERADASRRKAEDRLFVGSPPAIDEAHALWNGVVGSNGEGGAYETAIRRSAELAHAFQTRDRAWAEIPYLAQWILANSRGLTAPGAPETAPETALETALETVPLRRQPLPSGADKLLRSAIDDTRELADRLDEHLADRQWPAEAAALAARLDNSLQSLDKTFETECADLKTAGEDKQTLRRIAAVLAVPLVSGQERNWLRDRYLSIAQTITPAGAAYQVAAGQQAAAANADAAEEPIQRLRAWFSTVAHRPTHVVRRPPSRRNHRQPPASATCSSSGSRGRGTSCAGGCVICPQRSEGGWAPR
jgi:hypothetical protein